MGLVALSRAAICGVAFCLGVWASAQHRVWIVDAQGRPGTDFTDLQAAVDQAPVGDILDVRDGAYGQSPYLSVRRGVTIQFRAGAGLRWSLAAAVPAGQKLFVGALQSTTYPFTVGVEILPSEGTVSLHNCSIGLLRIRSARQVSLIGGSSRTIFVEDSAVAMSGCNIVGFDQMPPPYCITAWGALSVQRSHVTIDACRLAPGWFDVNCTRWYQGPTINLAGNSSVYLTRGTVVQSGFDGTLYGDATSGFVVLDPSIGTLAQSPELRVERRIVPALYIQAPAVGRSATGALHAEGAVGACAWLGRPIAAVPVPGLSGAWAVDPIQSILFLCGVPNNGVLGFAIAVPVHPALVGEVIALQGLAWLPGMTVTTWVVEMIHG